MVMHATSTHKHHIETQKHSSQPACTMSAILRIKLHVFHHVLMHKSEIALDAEQKLVAVVSSTPSSNAADRQSQH